MRRTIMRRGFFAVIIVFVMISTFFGIIQLSENAEAHIPGGEGNPLQLYSYFDPDASSKINLADDGIARDVYDEWEGAYVRNITLVGDSQDTRFCYLFLANDHNYLYIGLVYLSQSSTQNDYVSLYFDEGDGSGAYDGSHDDALTAGNEQFIMASGPGGNPRYWDGYWNGSSWIVDNNDNDNGKGPEDDFDFQKDFGNNYYNWEIRIPLDPKQDSVNSSDLNVGSNDELGFFIEIYDSQGGGEFFYWELTGNNSSDPSSYADLKLGIQRKDTTVYSTYANTGDPEIDGDITDDVAYANAYTREIILTNFTGGILNAKLYLCENPTNYEIFVGLIIYIDNTDSPDFLRVFTDQNHSYIGPGGEWGEKDGLLSVGANKQTENFQQVFGNNTYIDGYWDSDEKAWQDDTLDGDQKDGQGAVVYWNLPGTIEDRYEFEFRLPYSILSPYEADQYNDLYIDSTQVQGFLIEFYDDSASAGGQYFYWDLTTNLNAILTQKTASNVYICTGWAYLQTGGPALKPVTPIHGATVYGIDYIFRVEAEDEGGFDEVQFTAFQVEGDTSWYTLVQEPDTGVWYTYWDTTLYPDGMHNITIVAQDDEGITVKRIIPITIANGGAAVAPPSITLDSPLDGSKISEDQIFKATTFGIVGDVVFYVDGQPLGSMTETTPDTWQYTLNTTKFSDATHIIEVVATNSEGQGSDGGFYTFENWDLNQFTIIQPSFGGTVSEVITIIGDYEAEDSGDYAELFVDGEYIAFEDTETQISGNNIFQFLLNTTRYEDGTHTIKIVVYDPDGLSLSDSVVCTFLNRPVIQPFDPTEGQLISGTYHLTIEATDPNGNEITSASYRVDSGGWVGMTITAQGPPAVIDSTGTDLDTTAYPDGEHEIEYRVEDSSGAVATKSIPVIVDNTPPSRISIIYPVDGQYLEGMHTFLVEASDNNDIDLVEMELNSSEEWSYMSLNLETGYYELIVDTASFDDGPHTLDARVYDSAGNGPVSAIQITFNVDNTLPTLSINAPLNDQIVNGEEVLISANSTDAFLTIIEYRVDNGEWLQLNGGPPTWTDTWNSNLRSNGEHTMTFKASDGIGNVVTEVLTIYVDNDVPTVGIVAPLPGEYVEGIYTFKVVVGDEVGVTEVYITINENNYIAEFNSASMYWEAVMDTSVFSDGTYAINATVKDGVPSHTHSVPAFDFNIDNNPPSLGIEAPKRDEVIDSGVSSKYSIQVSSEDVFLSRVEVRVDESSWQDMSGGPTSWTYSWDHSALGDGEHDISARAKDGSGKSVEEMVTIFVDNTPPQLKIVNMPGEFSHVGSSFFIQLNIEDSLGVASVNYRFDNGSVVDMFVNKETGFYEAEVVTNSTGYNIEDGYHDLIITAIDLAGLEKSVTRRLYVDNTGPDITTKRPGSRATVSGEVNFQVEISDDTGTAEVYIRIGDGSWNEMRLDKFSGEYYYNWDSENAYNGKYDVDIKAVDSLGNVQEFQSAYVITVDNFPWIWLYIFLAGLIVLSLLAILNWVITEKPAKPKKEKPREELPEGPSPPPLREEMLRPPAKATITELPPEKEKIVMEEEEELPPLDEDELPPPEDIELLAEEGELPPTEEEVPAPGMAVAPTKREEEPPSPEDEDLMLEDLEELPPEEELSLPAKDEEERAIKELEGLALQDEEAPPPKEAPPELKEEEPPELKEEEPPELEEEEPPELKDEEPPELKEEEIPELKDEEPPELKEEEPPEPKAEESPELPEEKPSEETTEIKDEKKIKFLKRKEH